MLFSLSVSVAAPVELVFFHKMMASVRKKTLTVVVMVGVVVLAVVEGGSVV